MLEPGYVADAIRNATLEVFSTMLDLQVQAGAVVEDVPDTTGDRLIAMIGLAGPMSGTGRLTCTPTLAADMSARMFMTDPQEGPVTVNNEVLDAVAEVTNMIIGNVKTALEEKLGSMGMTIPTVVYGRNFNIRDVGGVQDTSVSFTMDGHEFSIYVGLAPNKGFAAHKSQLSLSPDAP